jgi:hypothetical protein
MKLSETARAMRKLADILDADVREHGDCVGVQPKPMLPAEQALGAAFMVVYLRDLITAGANDTYDRGALLVLLEVISRDPELFPCGVGVALWEAD